MDTEQLRERWLVRILVTRDPADPVPTAWDWGVPGADVTVLSGERMGLVLPPNGEPEHEPETDDGG